MRRIITLLCGLLCAAAPAAEIRLIRDDGSAGYGIASNDAAAAELLAEGLSLAAGTAFPGTAPGLPLFRIESASAAGDAFEIAVEADGGVVLTGNGVNAVASLLSDDLGLRFYTPASGLERPFGGPLAVVDITPRREDSPFRQRYPYFDAPTDPDWARFNRVRPGKFCGGWGTHTFQWLMPNEPWFRTHPEYFALHQGRRLPGGDMSDKGQLCLTNDDMIRQLTASALEKIAADPECEYLAVSQNDFSVWCSCPACAALSAAEGSQAGPLLYAVNRVADAIHERYPQVRVITEGYIETRRPPATIRPSENVLFRLCLSDRIKYTQYVPAAETAEGEYLRQWSRFGGDLFVWDYCVDFNDYLMPCADLPVLEANLDFYRSCGVTGVLNLGSYQSCDTAQRRLRAWVLAQKLWDPSKELAGLVRDFNYGYFGAAAGAIMQAYSELLDAEWRGWHGGRSSDRFAWSEGFLPRAEELFRRALEVAENAEYRARVERESLAVTYLRLATEGDSPEEVARWAELCRRYGIEKVSESGLTLEDILPRLANKRRDAALAAITPLNTVHLLPATRAFIEHGAVMADDPSAVLGMAASSSGESAQWGIHWHLDDFPEIDLNRRYRVKALIRAELNSTAGEAVKTTWWNALNNDRPGEFRSVDAGELSAAEYRWIDCGAVEPGEPGVYLLFSALGNGVVERLFLQGVALTDD